MAYSKLRRSITVGVLILSCLLIIFFIYRLSDKYQYSKLIISPSDYESLKNSRTESDEDLLSGLKFNEIPALFDRAAGRWMISISDKNNDYSPSVGITASRKDIKIAFCGNFSKRDDNYFVAYDDKVYREYVFSATTLPLVHIECETTEFTRDPVPIRFTLFDNRPGARHPVTESIGTIHIRGWSTIIFPKNAFRISLMENSAGKDGEENKTPLLDLRSDGDWLLYPAYNDPERIRNVFSSNLWFSSCASDNSFGIQNGMEYRYIELFLNDQYWGLYALGYPIDAFQVKISPNNQGNYDEFLFKAKEWGPHSEANPEYDGLILQFDAPQSDLNNGIGIMKAYFQQLENGAQGRLYHNEEKNVLDVWLYMKLIQAWDTVRIPGKMKNMMYTVKLSGQGRKILYAPWDMDIAWGSMISGAGNNFTLSYALEADDNSYDMTVNPVSILLQQNDQETIQKVSRRYRELRSDVWSDGTIDTMLDSLEKDIFDSGAYKRDIERWPESSHQEPELKLSLFKEYVSQRFISMDEYISDMGLYGN